MDVGLNKRRKQLVLFAKSPRCEFNKSKTGNFSFIESPRCEFNKRGQITLFIILGIVIVIMVGVFFLFLGRGTFETVENQRPESFIDKCMKDALSLPVHTILKNGGDIEPELFKLHQNEKYNYLCYQQNYYLGCINQKPMLVQYIEQEIKKNIDDKINQCFEDYESDLKNKGFNVLSEKINWSVELVPGSVDIKVKKKISISKGDSSEIFNNYDVRVLSPLYNLVMVAREVVNQESRFCNFDYNGYMLLYPWVDIKKNDVDGSKLYKLVDRKSGLEFKFAVRSCVLPAGL